MQRVAYVAELFLPAQLEVLQTFRLRDAAEAIEFLAARAKDVPQIAVPAENGAEDIVEIVGGSIRSETETRQMTMGLTRRRTARRITRLKDALMTIAPGYLTPLDPRPPDALDQEITATLWPGAATRQPERQESGRLVY